MRNNSTEYKLPNEFCTRIEKLSSGITLSNYINITESNCDKYSIIHNSDNESRNNNSSINKNPDYLINPNNPNKLYSIYNWVENMYLFL